MQYSPHEIKDRLIKALDRDNNVVDMVIVLETISTLEKYPITREALEATRLGKYINDLRKKTKDESLAKRAKRLVKGWQKLIQTPQQNGDHSPALSRPGISPASSISRFSRLDSPASVPPLSRPGVSPATPLSRAGRLDSPLSTRGRPNSNGSMGSRPTTPGNLTSPGLTPSTSKSVGKRCLRSKPLSPAVASLRGRTVSPLISSSDSRGPTEPQSADEGYASNKKRRRVLDEKLKFSDTSSDIFVNGGDSQQFMNDSSPPNASLGQSYSSPALLNMGRSPFTGEKVARATKVKTTAQLIAGLQAKNQTSNFSDETVKKIATNQIEKEPDDINRSVVPPEAKPRPKRKKGASLTAPPQSTDATLKKTKNEMVKKFLESSIPQTTSCESNRTSPVFSRTDFSTSIDDNEDEDNDANRSVDDASESALSRPSFHAGSCFESVNSNSRVESVKNESVVIEDPYALLPPIDYSLAWDYLADNQALKSDNEAEADSIEAQDESMDVEVLSPSIVVDDATVDKLHSEELSGLNGCYDSDGKWHDWSQTLSEKTCGDNVLPILPYTDIDF